MNIKEILDSGILENYCLGLTSKEENLEVANYLNTFPELRGELDEIEKGLEKFAFSYRMDPDPQLKTELLNHIVEIESLFDERNRLKKFHHIGPESDYRKWKNLSEGIHPPEEFEIHMHKLFGDGSNFLFVAWVKDRIPPETHTDIYESFLLLEGTCTCKLEEETIKLIPGDFFPIPLYKLHSLQVTSDKPVKFILQRKLSA